MLSLHQLWPDAPIYTAAYEPSKFPEFAGLDVRPTWLNRVPLAKRKHQLFTLPRAWAFKSLNLGGYDVVLSSSSAESKYVRKGRALHICYCHTPIRYYWSDYDWYRQHPPFGWLNPLAGAVLPLLLPYLRRMDYRAAQQVDYFIANSKHVQTRIKQYYHRESTVIYPPVNTQRFSVSSGEGEYFLVLGRQVAYKRLDLAVDAFNQLGLPLVVAGAGEEIKRQRARSNSNIRYLGRVPEAELPRLLSQAKALIYPQLEDFGIAPVEAMASGRPVIAYGAGGALETVIDGQTGVLFDQQTPAALAEAVRRFQSTRWDAAAIRAHAEQFDEAVFKRAMKEFVIAKYTERAT